MSLRDDDYDPRDHLPDETVWIVTAGPAGAPATHIEPHHVKAEALADFATQIAAGPGARVRVWAEDIPLHWSPDHLWDYAQREYSPADPTGHGLHAAPCEDSHDDDRLAALGLLQ